MLSLGSQSTKKCSGRWSQGQQKSCALTPVVPVYKNAGSHAMSNVSIWCRTFVDFQWKWQTKCSLKSRRHDEGRVTDLTYRHWLEKRQRRISSARRRTSQYQISFLKCISTLALQPTLRSTTTTTTMPMLLYPTLNESLDRCFHLKPLMYLLHLHRQRRRRRRMIRRDESPWMTSAFWQCLERATLAR